MGSLPVLTFSQQQQGTFKVSGFYIIWRLLKPASGVTVVLAPSTQVVVSESTAEPTIDEVKPAMNFFLHGLL